MRMVRRRTMSSPQRTGVLSSSPLKPLDRLERRSPRRWAWRWAVNGAMAAAVVPVSLLAGVWVGSLSSKTVLAVLPALIIVAVVPPLGVVGAEAWLGQRLEPGRMRWGRTVGVALGVQVLLLGGAVGAGASARKLGEAAVLTLVEVAVLATVVTWVARRSASSGPAPERKSAP
jgi:hypothetical protein